MRFRASLYCGVVAVAACCPAVRAAERITLRNGFSVSCDHRQPLDEERVRLYFDVASTSYLDVALANIVGTEMETSAVPNVPQVPASIFSLPTATEASQLDTLVRQAGEAHRLNVDLLYSVVNAESGGHPRAVSHAGAQGLMQLMPSTARSVGVSDSFAPDQNLRGGTTYLDALLRHYHDDLALTLAAYNAGPGAVDRYHGIPPFRETQRYIARVIREFNRRTLLAQRSTAASAGAIAAR